MKAAGAHLIVDAMNVIGSRPDGWWRDRARAIRAFVERLQRLAAIQGCDLTVVIDGRPLAGLAEGWHGGVEVRYAGRSGPNAADDRIIELIAAHREPSTLEVVTSDRALASRARALGASVRGAASLFERLDRSGA